MYEAKQRKEKVSRTIGRGMVKPAQAAHTRINIIQKNKIKTTPSLDLNLGTKEYKEIVASVTEYNSVNTKDNLKKVDEALGKYENSFLLHPIEHYQKIQIENKMPNERKAMFGEEKMEHFSDMCDIAKNLSKAATSNMSIDSEYNKYFNPTKGEKEAVDSNNRRIVNSVYNNIYKALENKEYSFVNDYNERCNIFAFVNPNDRVHKINLSPAYLAASETGINSKPGVIIHEMSHFADVGNTTDYAYGTDAQKLLPDKAIKNADTYEYAAERAWDKKKLPARPDRLQIRQQ